MGITDKRTDRQKECACVYMQARKLHNYVCRCMSACVRRYNYAHDCVSLCVGVYARVSALSVPGFIIRMPGLALVDGNGGGGAPEGFPEEVSKLVFYAQSTGAVASGRLLKRQRYSSSTCEIQQWPLLAS